MKINLIKQLDGSLKPADETATESLKKIKYGTAVSCEVKKVRNYQYHKKYFSLLKIVLDNSDKHDTIDNLLLEIKLRLGYVDTIIVDNKAAFTPKSISFASMDEIQFSNFYSQTIDIILKYFLVGTDKQELENAVLSYC